MFGRQMDTRGQVSHYLFGSYRKNSIDAFAARCYGFLIGLMPAGADHEGPFTTLHEEVYPPDLATQPPILVPLPDWSKR